jgi:hypothetical protein
MKNYRTQQRKYWIVYLLMVVVVVLASSCSTQKGYNYKKHYKKQNRKQNFVRIFDLHNCKKNNHAYKY